MKCSICRDELKNEEDIHSTLCGHIFHAFCIIDFIDKHSKCPECRCNADSSHMIYIDALETETADERMIKLLKEIDTEKSEKQKLKETLENLRKENVNITQLLEDISLELEKEKQNSLNLAADKENLQSLHNRILQAASSASLNDLDLRPSCSNARKETALEWLAKEKKKAEKADHTGVLITGISQDWLIKGTIKNIVLCLANLLQLNLTSEHIKSGYISPEKHSVPFKSGCFSIIVEFETAKQQQEFIFHSKKLQRLEEYKNIEVFDSRHNLYQYAKQLRHHGYEFIYCKKHVVFARKFNAAPIEIVSRQQVDDIIKSTNSKDK